MPAPPNDLLADAEALTDESGSVAFDLTDATSTPGDSDPYPDIWYTWNAPADGVLTARIGGFNDYVVTLASYEVQVRGFDIVSTVIATVNEHLVVESEPTVDGNMIFDMPVASGTDYTLCVRDVRAATSVLTGTLTWVFHVELASSPGPAAPETYDALTVRRYAPTFAHVGS